MSATTISLQNTETADVTMPESGKIIYWLNAGSATLVHDGDSFAITSGTRMEMNLGRGEVVTFTATANGTVVKWNEAVI